MFPGLLDSPTRVAFSGTLFASGTRPADVFENVRAETLLSTRRLVVASIIAAFAVLLDFFVLNLSTFASSTDVAVEVGIHAVGIYLGMTVFTGYSTNE